MIDSLQDNGVPKYLLDWIWGYLTKRKHIVTINDFFSETCDVPSGVPQGSHLEPLFFILFTNDLKRYLIYCKLFIHAVDIKIFHEVTMSEDCATLQVDLNRLSNYFKLKSLSLNLDKCASISYTRKEHIINYIYHIDCPNHSVVSEVKDLSLTLDSKLIFPSAH